MSPSRGSEGNWTLYKGEADSYLSPPLGQGNQGLVHLTAIRNGAEPDRMLVPRFWNLLQPSLPPAEKEGYSW